MKTDKEKKLAERGTVDNPCSNLKEAYDLANGAGPGKTIWLYNSEGRLTIHVDTNEENQPYHHDNRERITERDLQKANRIGPNHSRIL